VIQLDLEPAARSDAKLMQPFMQAEVTEALIRRIRHRLPQAGGREKGGSAGALVDKFLSDAPTPSFWKARLEKLRIRIQGQTP
jgi:hypothetical protein